MTERLRTSRLFGKRTGPGDTPPYGSEFLTDPVVGGPYDEGARGAGDWADPADPAQDGGLDTLVRLTTEHRADSLAGLTLMLAGTAAVASLWFPWVRGDHATGVALLRRSVAVAGAGVEALGRGDGLWQPAAIVLGGALLIPLGVLLFTPSRTHRIMGLLALCAAMAVVAGVVARLAQAGWSWADFDRGMWCAVAAAVLGVMGALKAMLRIPRVTLQEARPFWGRPPGR